MNRLDLTKIYIYLVNQFGLPVWLTKKRIGKIPILIKYFFRQKYYTHNLTLSIAYTKIQNNLLSLESFVRKLRSM